MSVPQREERVALIPPILLRTDMLMDESFRAAWEDGYDIHLSIRGLGPNLWALYHGIAKKKSRKLFLLFCMSCTDRDAYASARMTGIRGDRI
jgi:hypothetical protein